ncbi:hypothetical protein ACTXJX_17405 [Glutamicibacter ardleyensis]|uniref:hypothetical protein n=1 Tax=Glutamicibacter ardleyensis TaxID=225894 RepID=UPI003FD5F606
MIDQIIAMNLNIPRKAENVTDVLLGWGLPEKYLSESEGLNSGVCHSPLNWHGTVELDSLPAVYAKALKFASHKNAVTLLNALAQASIVSQYTVQEALSLTMHLMNLDFRNGDERYRAHWVESWEPVFWAFESISNSGRRNERPMGSQSIVQMMIQQFKVMVS